MDCDELTSQKTSRPGLTPGLCCVVKVFVLRVAALLRCLDAKRGAWKCPGRGRDRREGPT